MDELYKVHFRVDLNSSSNFFLFDYEKLHKELSSEITSYLKKNGVSYEDEGIFEGGGGGGLDSFVEAIKLIFTNKELLGILTSILALVRALPLYLRTWLAKAQNKTKPRVLLNFKLESKADIDKEEVNQIDGMLSQLLLNLKYIGDDVCVNLSASRPSFLFDLKLITTITKKSSSVVYLIPHEQRNFFNSYRLIRLIQSLRIKNNKEIFYEFNGIKKLFLISRTDFDVEYKEEYGLGDLVSNGDCKDYYLFLSSKILGD